MSFEIPRIDDINTPWLEILVKFGFRNLPFILESWSTSNWTATKNWVLPNGKPNKEFLKENYGDSVVPILVNGSEYKSTKLTEFIDNMKDPEVYLKDWHFQNKFGTDMYNLHPFFSRDFVNCESWTTKKEENPFGDDYRFIYIGGAGTWTKFHADVVCSHSWSANICGRKKWFMMPPGSEELFKCASSESGYLDDIRNSPELFDKANVITFIQEPGEIVFVPSNWYHQVENLEETISINHNWMNSTNLSLVREFLERREQDVRNELRDCSSSFLKHEFEEKVEEILFADARLNKAKFHRLCELMLTHERLSKLYDCATASERLPKDFATDPKDLETIIRYGEIFKACHSTNSSEHVQKAENISEDEKSQLINIVTQKLSEVSEEDPIPWSVNIVIGNSHVAKSLRPVISIKMPTVDGETFEFDIDSFAQLRKQLAEVVLAVNPQE